MTSNMHVPFELIEDVETHGTDYFCENEWDPLEEIIVGRADHSCFPAIPMQAAANIVPRYYLDEFKPNNPFPAEILKKADEELDNFARVLKSMGVKVRRPREVDWLKVGGYTGSMMRDGLMVIGNTLFESAWSWGCRRDEIELLHGPMIEEIESKGLYRFVRAPKPPSPDRIFEVEPGDKWAINNSRVAFDCADFTRAGKYVITHLSNATNQKGIDFVRSHLPPGYELIVFECKNPMEMHIDVTFIPIAPETAMYNPDYVDVEELRRHKPLDTWRLLVPPNHHQPIIKYPPPYMADSCLHLNNLIHGKYVFCEKDDTTLHEYFRRLGFIPIPLPFKHVWCLGGSLHCATLDLRRKRPSKSKAMTRQVLCLE